MPAMPTTRCLGKPLTWNARCAIASSGFVTGIRMQSGEFSTTSRTTLVTIFMLVSSRSSRDIPGFLAIPDVTTTMSESAVSS